MSHLPFAILAYLLNSISVTINKILLKSKIPDPFVYIFYVSIFSLILLPGIFFTQIPSLTSLILGSFSTVFWTIGAYFMFCALRVGVVSRVIPLIGTLITLILFFTALHSSSINLNQTWAIIFLVLGMIFITFLDLKGKFSKKEALYIVASSLFFAFSYIILRQAYIDANFFSVLVYSRLILIPFIVIVLISPLRKKVLNSDRDKINIFGKSGIIFLIGQASGGASELLLLFSISLANPALVNSLQGTQYIFLLFFGIFLKENFTKLSLVLKLIGIIFIGLGLYILAFSTPDADTAKPKIGISFSARYARQLNLDPHEVFSKIVDDLDIKYLRLPVYWEEVEKFPNDLNFSSVDYYLDLALKKDIKVILVLGYKQPRWPECFDPPWVKNLIRLERDLRIVNLVKAEITHFKKYQNIYAWQIENEPLLPFGNCDHPTPATEDRLKKEIQIVKSTDSRPIILTDSGELGFWVTPMSLSDTFGTTLYRTVWNPYLGMQDYPLPPIFYTFKKEIIGLFTGRKPVIISELQMEPWISDSKLPSQSDLQKQLSSFPISRLKDNLDYAKQTNFSEIYLWGVEWWYFMEKQGHPEYLKEAKKLFLDN